MKSVWILLVAVVGCGYHLAGTPSTVPGGASSITIELFGNQTHQDGIEVQLRRAIEDEFRRRGPLSVVPEGGDLVLSGAVRRFANVPVSFIGRDQAVQFQGTMQVSVHLKDRQTGKVLYVNKALQQTQDFAAVSGVVVTSSPRFQQGLMNARDLPVLTNVQITETRARQATADLVESLARDIYLQTMEGF